MIINDKYVIKQTRIRSRLYVANVDSRVYQHMLRHHENLQNVQSTISGLSRAMTPPLRGAFAHNIR